MAITMPFLKCFKKNSAFGRGMFNLKPKWNKQVKKAL
jgi:hypothetical protein